MMTPQTPIQPHLLNESSDCDALREHGALPTGETCTRWTWARIVGGAFGLGTQAFFVFTVVYLFQFLRYGGSDSSHGSLAFDFLLATGFVIPHSLLLVPVVHTWMKATIPSGLLGCVHCNATCISLLVLFHFWDRSEFTVWSVHGVAKSIVLIGFYTSWVALFYSLYLTGMGYQTGLTQWCYWIRNQPAPRRKFVVRGAYRWLRHPIYMSFLGLIWFTPTMTLDHVILTSVWTVYIYAGSYFKDQRMLRYIGSEYRNYATRVPGLPLIGFGPLLRMRPQ